MSDNDSMFLNTLNDLREKISKNDKYSSIRACGLLRHLLLDGGNSLYDLVNKESNRRLKMKFHVSDYLLEIPIKPFSHWKTLLPVTNKTYNVSRGVFLSIKMLTYGDYEYSVHEIIDAASHKMGGIHSGIPETEKEKTFIKLERLAQIIDIDFHHSSFTSIIQVSLEAMKPLELLLKENTSTGGF